MISFGTPASHVVLHDPYLLHFIIKNVPDGPSQFAGIKLNWGRKDIIACLYVSRDWATAGVPILWRDYAELKDLLSILYTKKDLTDLCSYRPKEEKHPVSFGTSKLVLTRFLMFNRYLPWIIID